MLLISISRLFNNPHPCKSKASLDCTEGQKGANNPDFLN